MKRKCRVMAAGLAAMMAVSAAGCGSGGDAPASQGGAGSADALEVKIWDSAQVDGLQQIADEWTAQSGIKVNIQVLGWDEYWTLLEAGATGGDMPDVFWMHSNVAQKYMENDLLLKLNDYISQSEDIDLANYYEGITGIYQLGDAQYAVPKDHDTVALCYNKAIFDQYQVAYPDETWTWDDFYEAAKAITDAGQGSTYGYSIDVGNNQDGWWNIVYDYGGYVISEDHKTSGMDDPKTLEAMEFLGKLIADTMPAQSVISENGSGTLFTSGVTAMTTQGSWNINTFYTSDNSENFAWSVLPYYDQNGNGTADPGERCTIYNGLGWAAAAGTDAPDAAWSLIEWFCKEENQVKQADLGVTMAGFKGASDSYPSAFEGMDISAFLDMESEGTLVVRPCSKYTTNWETMMGETLVGAWNDVSTMKDACTKIAAEMNAQLAQE